MPRLALVFGLALVSLGLLAYLQPAVLGMGKDGLPATAGHPTSLSPVGIGAILLLTGLLSLAVPTMRKHAMHLAAVAALLGTIGGFVPVILRNFAVQYVAVKVGLGMAALSLVFLILCVRSFIQARQARRAAATTTS